MTKATLRGTERLAQTVAALARLLDQTMNDIHTLDSEFHEEVERNAGEVKRLREASGNWEAERAGLLVECERARDLVEQIKREHEQALSDSDEAAAIALERQVTSQIERAGAEMTSRWEADRATLQSERNRAQQRFADMAAECDALRAALEQARQAPPPAAAKQPGPDTEAIQSEMARVEGLIQVISKIVEDPNTELAVVIRKNVERAELESYLRGLRFMSATP
ncbi:MAG TPA: hypothetical protein VGK48_19400 [Terriglobia bacterium]